MLLQGGVSYNDTLNKNPISSGNSLQGGVSYDSLFNNNSGAGQSMGSGGMVQGGNAPGFFGEIKKEVDARKAGITNAMANYANNLGKIDLAANSFRTTFNPSMTPIQNVQPLQSNLYNYLVR